ncbi:hypothetical protein M407DRAFT_83235 [Tulasnella calospora MUT 4182]|uniref:HNH nuclease domain-containing protein n=1 Tax=Tulasnella calospora MUT 4182 TaxID=1051891 RepID=A0A0C3KCA8_9AGAM|nr:hypothetical protein M407DRAFT_83235 [Tulasnella calospora MUT 4182]
MVPEKLDAYRPSDANDRTADLLRALSDWAPSEVGQRNVATDILLCRSDECLRKLAERYKSGLILPIRAAGGRTPRVSNHPSRPSVDLDDIVNPLLLERATGDRRIMRDLVLHRENYRCILTGKCDLNSTIGENIKTVIQDDEDVTVLECAHILPFSFLPSSENPGVLERYGMIWQVITAFSGIPLDELNGDNINRVESGITLESAMHQLFGSLSLCFEATDEVNTYRMRYWGIPRRIQSIIPDTVTFVPRAEIPVPDPPFLALHAACAKVVHQSGMAEILDKFCRDLERTAVLSTDGSSAHLLSHALEMIAVS